MTRKLRIYVEWGFTGIPDDTDDHDLPEGWDDWTAQRREDYIRTSIETVVFNQVSTSGEVVEVDD